MATREGSAVPTGGDQPEAPGTERAADAAAGVAGAPVVAPAESPEPAVELQIAEAEEIQSRAEGLLARIVGQLEQKRAGLEAAVQEAAGRKHAAAEAISDLTGEIEERQDALRQHRAAIEGLLTVLIEKIVSAMQVINQEVTDGRVPGSKNIIGLLKQAEVQQGIITAIKGRIVRMEADLSNYDPQKLQEIYLERDVAEEKFLAIKEKIDGFRREYWRLNAMERSAKSLIGAPCDESYLGLLDNIVKENQEFNAPLTSLKVAIQAFAQHNDSLAAARGDERRADEEIEGFNAELEELEGTITLLGAGKETLANGREQRVGAERTAKRLAQHGADLAKAYDVSREQLSQILERIRDRRALLTAALEGKRDDAVGHAGRINNWISTLSHLEERVEERAAAYLALQADTDSAQRAASLRALSDALRTCNAVLGAKTGEEAPTAGVEQLAANYGLVVAEAQKEVRNLDPQAQMTHIARLERALVGYIMVSPGSPDKEYAQKILDELRNPPAEAEAPGSVPDAAPEPVAPAAAAVVTRETPPGSGTGKKGEVGVDVDL